jgi:hypothetical protein
MRKVGIRFAENTLRLLHSPLEKRLPLKPFKGVFENGGSGPFGDISITYERITEVNELCWDIKDTPIVYERVITVMGWAGITPKDIQQPNGSYFTIESFRNFIREDLQRTIAFSRKNPAYAKAVGFTNDGWVKRLKVYGLNSWNFTPEDLGI